jgi:NACHT domain
MSSTAPTNVSPGDTAQPDTELRIKIEETILESLTFPYMNDRYHEIEDAHKKTFDWIYRPINSTTRWDEFSNWLSHGEGIYWINGKAGSGKSTLMRYICEDSRTSSLLEEWAGESGEIFTASFFFWKSGVPGQASQLGLLRSLLHSLLSQKRDLMPKAVPKIWTSAAKSLSNLPSDSGLAEAFRRMGRVRDQSLLEQSLRTFFELLSDTRVCLFIDGLDVYDGDPASTIKLLKSISSSDVKICVSSRPWNEFHQAFNGLPGLRLQDLTFDDIHLYINKTLVGDGRMSSCTKKTRLELPNSSQRLSPKQTVYSYRSSSL